MSFNDDWQKGYSGQAPPSGGSALDSWQAGKATADWNAAANTSSSSVPNFDQDWSQPQSSTPTYSGGGGAAWSGSGTASPGGLLTMLRWLAYLVVFPATLVGMIVAIVGAPALLILAGNARPGFGKAYRVAVCAVFFYLVAQFMAAAVVAGSSIGPALLNLLAGVGNPRWLLIGQLVGIPLAGVVIAWRLRKQGFGGFGGLIKAIIAAIVIIGLGLAGFVTLGMSGGLRQFLS